MALQYRDKHTPLQPTHYICSTGLAIAHVQNVVIHKFRRQLAERGIVDDRIETFGTMETRLFELTGLPYSKYQQAAWLKQVQKRAKRSCYRQTIEYKRKRRDGRKQLTEKRGKAKSSHEYQYKGSTGGRSVGHGESGACTCIGVCVRNCPCKADGRG